MLAQTERRPRRPGPESTGPLEAEIDNVRDKLRRRAQTLCNHPRTNLLLRLLVAGRRGTDSEREWAEKVRQYLVQLNGIPQQHRLAEATAASDRPHPCVDPSG